MEEEISELVTTIDFRSQDAKNFSDTVIYKARHNQDFDCRLAIRAAEELLSALKELHGKTAV